MLAHLVNSSLSILASLHHACNFFPSFPGNRFFGQDVVTVRQNRQKLSGVDKRPFLLSSVNIADCLQVGWRTGPSLPNTIHVRNRLRSRISSRSKHKDRECCYCELSMFVRSICRNVFILVLFCVSQPGPRWLWTWMRLLKCTWAPRLRFAATMNSPTSPKSPVLSWSSGLWWVFSGSCRKKSDTCENGTAACVVDYIQSV